MYLLTLDWLTASHHSHDQYEDPETGVVWICTELEGWTSAPARRTKHTARPTSDGSHRSAAYRDTRSYVVKGRYFTDDPSLGWALQNRLPSLMRDPGERYPLTVQGPDGTALTAYVEQSSAEILVAQTGPYVWEWSIPTIAADPYRYHQDWVSGSASPGTDGAGGIDFSGSGVVFADPGVDMGTAPSPCAVTAYGAGWEDSLLVLEIRGPGSGLVVTDDAGRGVAVAGQVPEGQSLFVNCSPRIAIGVPGAPAPLPANGALLSGANARGALAIPNGWPRLEPGVARTFTLTGQLGAGSGLTVHTRGCVV